LILKQVFRNIYYKPSISSRDFKNGIGKRVGNEFFIRLNRLDYAFANAFANAFDHAFDHGYAHAFDHGFAHAFDHGFAHAFDHGFAHAFDHAFLDVLNGAVFDIVFLRHLNVSKIKNIRFSFT
jgi:hypothetical protein